MNPIFLIVALLAFVQSRSGEDEIPPLRRVDSPVIKIDEQKESLNSKFFRGDTLVLEQSVWSIGSRRTGYSQTVWIDGERAIRVSRTDSYHFRSVGIKENRPKFEEIDLDMDGDWDLMLFEPQLTTEAFTLDEDGFLTPVPPELLNEANSKIREDSEWLLKVLSEKLQ